jgi:siroheme synthase
MSHIGSLANLHRAPAAAGDAAFAGAPPVELPPGTVWLLGMELTDPALDAALAAPALRNADAVLCDAGLPQILVECVRGRARYVERVPASAEGRDRARGRCLALAKEGWRIVRIFRREPVGAADAIVTAAALAEAGIPLRLEGIGLAVAGSAEIEMRSSVAAVRPMTTASFAGTAG